MGDRRQWTATTGYKVLFASSNSKNRLRHIKYYFCAHMYINNIIITIHILYNILLLCILNNMMFRSESFTSVFCFDRVDVYTLFSKLLMDIYNIFYFIYAIITCEGVISKS